MPFAEGTWGRVRLREGAVLQRVSYAAERFPQQKEQITRESLRLIGWEEEAPEQKTRLPPMHKEKGIPRLDST